MVRRVLKKVGLGRISAAQMYCERIFGKTKLKQYLKNIKQHRLRGAPNGFSRPRVPSGTVVTIPMGKEHTREVRIAWDGRRFCYLSGFQWAAFSEVRGTNWADPDEMLYALLAVLADPHPARIIQGQGCISFFNRQGMEAMRK